MMTLEALSGTLFIFKSIYGDSRINFMSSFLSRSNSIKHFRSPSRVPVTNILSFNHYNNLRSNPLLSTNLRKDRFHLVSCVLSLYFYTHTRPLPWITRLVASLVTLRGFTHKIKNTHIHVYAHTRPSKSN